LGVGLTTPPRKTIIVTKPSKKENGGQSPFRAVALRKKKKKKFDFNWPYSGTTSTKSNLKYFT
jgi:hypothetical protein